MSVTSNPLNAANNTTTFDVFGNLNSQATAAVTQQIQVFDSFGADKPAFHDCGALYERAKPEVNLAKPPGEWQSFDITLIGRMITVVANGTTVISNREIPGITGGALDSDEGSPGPIMLQGDHGPIDFRKVTLTPAR